jgi:hypothetical protein
MKMVCLATLLNAIFWMLAIHPASSQVILSRATTIIIGEREPLPLKKAAADLASDMQSVFGAPVRVVHQAEAGPSTIVISSVAFRSHGGSDANTPEILQIRALGTGSKQRAVLLTGSDMRGAIYAVYQFSQQFLGVDPMYFWTDIVPAQKEQVIVPAGFFLQDGPPTFTHRGFFINDEDLLTGWHPGTKDGADISLEIWDKIFETILRLKGDMVVPGTFLFPDEPQIRLAQNRGLVISQPVLATHGFRWPADQPYSFKSHPEVLISAWKHSVETFCPDQEVIWTLGYRGRSDRPFWVDDPSGGTTDAEHAATIQSAVAEEMKILKDKYQNGPMIMNAWMEMVPLLKKDLLHVPEGVTLVWPDDGHGNLRDGGAISKGQGVYYHTAMYDEFSNQLTEAVPVQRIQHELGRAAAAGATKYLLINTSDIRPVVMTTQAAMELGWGTKPWLANPNQSSLFLQNWARDHYGAKAAQILAEYYQAYFDAPGRYDIQIFPWSPHLLEDNAYHFVARSILVNLMRGDDTVREHGTMPLRQVAALFERSTAEAQPRWERVKELAQESEPLIWPQGRKLFQAHVLTQLGIEINGNLMLHEICKAAQAQTTAEQLTHVEKAITYTQAALQSLHDAEFGKWAGFYKGDLMVNVRQTLALAEGYRDMLKGRPLPKDLIVAVYPEPPYDVIEAYQGERVVPTY